VVHFAVSALVQSLERRNQNYDEPGIAPPCRHSAGLTQLITPGSGYIENPLRQNLFRAGHAHAAVLLFLSLVALRYVDEANLSEGWKRYVRSAIPSAAIFLPAAFFFSVLSPNATAPNGFICLAYVGAVILASGLLILGIGLIKKPHAPSA
jgi:hypothetical protein